jgi:hypothetical protein
MDGPTPVAVAWATANLHSTGVRSEEAGDAASIGDLAMAAMTTATIGMTTCRSKPTVRPDRHAYQIVPELR